MIKKTILILSIALCLAIAEMTAQSGFRIYNKVTTTEVALATSYVYYARVISVETTHQLGRRGRWTYELAVGPQVGLSRFEPNDSQPLQTGLELGFKVGLLIERSLSEKWSIVGDISVSPYYITAGLQRQVDGFLFEDALNVGVRYKVTETVSLAAMIAFRHLSNASTRRPNGGINNLGAGIAFVYQPKR